MEGEPSSLAKVAQLFILSLAWGMQIWVTFISGFVLIRSVSRHTFGLVQSKLFPFYFYALVACAFLNLSIFAYYHPRELLSTVETLQSSLRFLPWKLRSPFWMLMEMPPCPILDANVLQAPRAVVPLQPRLPCLQRSQPAAMFRWQAIEREHGLGGEVGLAARRETYQQLRERDPKYQAARQTFFKRHGLSSLCNLACLACNGVNPLCMALHLSSL
ncbi:hypothetical protein UY3_05573 [Chelonia mydas]|uniref:Transmembrane protein 205 n=1 Tax=Chelonia mydas TaxID=8469 RepID=M7BJ91_CHEMY|nr:hypothetical protein UY3_05573 [Chelonia mydas]